MTSEDDTRQPARLPLMDRARLGLPLEEPELTPQQIAELEFPENIPATVQRWWEKQIEQGIERGNLAAREERTVTHTHGEIQFTQTYLDGVRISGSQKVKSASPSTPNNRRESQRWLVSRDAYQIWRAGAATFHAPDVSFIDLWLSPPTSTSQDAAPVSHTTNLTKPARLPLAERARRGLLAGESKLLIHEIAELEYPNHIDITKRDNFERLLHGLTTHSLFPGFSMQTLERHEYRLCPVKNRVTVVAWSIPRDAYRTWRATQYNLPADSLIHLWLGAALAPSAPNLPQSEPDRPESGVAESRNGRRKRVDALAEAIEAAIEILSPDGRLPTPALLFEYLRTLDKTGVVISGDSKTVFYWIASNGNKQSADISTITKRLDRMKQGD